MLYLRVTEQTVCLVASTLAWTSAVHFSEAVSAHWTSADLQRSNEEKMSLLMIIFPSLLTMSGNNSTTKRGCLVGPYSDSFAFLT